MITPPAIQEEWPDHSALTELSRCIGALRQAAQILHEEGLGRSANNLRIIATDAEAVLRAELEKLK